MKPEPMHQRDEPPAPRPGDAAIRSKPERCARALRARTVPPWPMIVLDSTQCLDRPGVVDGKQVEGTNPVRTSTASTETLTPAASVLLEQWLRRDGPGGRVFDERGTFFPNSELVPGSRSPRGTRRKWGRNPQRQRWNAAAVKSSNCRITRLCDPEVPATPPLAVPAIPAATPRLWLRDGHQRNDRGAFSPCFGPRMRRSLHGPSAAGNGSESSAVGRAMLPQG